MSRPWMPLYIADYRNKTASLTAAEHGAYLLLIMHYWVNGGLPNDEDRLIRISSMTPAEWKKSRDILQAFFHDGWKHERIDTELAKAVQISNKRRAAAKQRHSKNDANASANAEQDISNCIHTRDVSCSDVSNLEEYQEEQASRRKRPKIPLPANFIAERDVALGLGWDEERISEQEQQFKDNAIAHDRRYVDWDAAWRNWVRSPFQKRVEKSDARERGDAW